MTKCILAFMEHTDLQLKHHQSGLVDFELSKQN